MSPMLTIAKREFRSYFDSPLAYVVICLSYLLLGVAFFVWPNDFFGVGRASLRTLFDFMPVGLSLLVVPVVTMRLMAEERRSGTLEMLITLPVKDSDVVLGKYFGALGLVLTLVGATLAYPFAMFVWPWDLGPIDFGPIIAGYVGVVLFSAAAVAIGLLISSLTESQAVAFFVTAVVLAGLWGLGFANHLQDTAGDVLAYASTQARLEVFSRGIIDLRGIVYFLGIAVLGLMFSFRALERRRWA